MKWSFSFKVKKKVIFPLVAVAGTFPHHGGDLRFFSLLFSYTFRASLAFSEFVGYSPFFAAVEVKLESVDLSQCSTPSDPLT